MQTRHPEDIRKLPQDAGQALRNAKKRFPLRARPKTRPGQKALFLHRAVQAFSEAIRPTALTKASASFMVLNAEGENRTAPCSPVPIFLCAG